MNKFFIYLLLLTSCASIQSLEGGAKDETPPIIVSQNPDSAALNVSTNKIELVFNEYVQLKNASNLLLISPNQNTPPTIVNKGKKVTITLNDTLLSNTTYSININGSIVDINEGNPLENKILFSTGSYIDSLTYSGFVNNIETTQPCEDCSVLLYITPSDSNVLLRKPDYLARTNKAGLFQFTNLPENTFQLVSISDENKNLRLDRKEFTSLYTIIKTDTSNNTADSLILFPYITYQKPSYKIVKPQIPGIIKLAFSEYITSTTQLLLNNNPLKYKFNESRDTLIAYYTPTDDTTNLTLITSSDTTYLTVLKSSNVSVPIKLEPISISSESIVLRCNHYLKSISSQAFHLSLNGKQIDTDSIYLVDNQINIKAFILTDSLYILNVDSFAVTNIENIYNTLDTINLPIISSNNPKLKLAIVSTDSIHKLLHITSNNQIMYSATFTKDTTLTITNLKPGKYQVKIISDINENHYWDTGNPISNRPPEPIQHSAEFELRNNWDKELIINN